jgi:hypothetical protein
MSYMKSENKFISPMKDLLYRFLESKKAAGYKYRVEERSLFVLDKFLNTTLSHEDPLSTVILSDNTLLNGVMRVIRHVCID